jgi:shikimate kinase
VERPPLLLLIGLRCSGKTTLGEAVARMLSTPWSDLDPMALSRLGCRTVTEAFETRGEVEWRRAEADALAEALAQPDLGVLSLGGGAPTTARAAAAIRASQASGNAVVALLHPGEEELVRRLGQGRGDRPRLARDDAAEVAAMSRERLPLYRSLADLSVDTRRPAAACAARLACFIRQGRWAWPSRPASG